DGEEAVAEVRLRRRARADASAGIAEEIELMPVRMRAVNDGRARAEAAALGEQLDRAEPVLGQAFLDLARLLVRMHVQRQRVLRRICAELLEPVAWARAHRMRRHADAGARRSQLFESAEVLRDGRLPEAFDPAARIGGVEEHDLDAGVARGVDRRMRLHEAEVVELADGGVAGGTQLAVDARVERTHLR